MVRSEKVSKRIKAFLNIVSTKRIVLPSKSIIKELNEFNKRNSKTNHFNDRDGIIYDRMLEYDRMGSDVLLSDEELNKLFKEKGLSVKN